MASLRDVFVRLGIKTDPKGANLATKQLDNIKQAAKSAIAAFAGFATVKFVKSIADDTRELGDRLDKVSQQVGVTTDSLQELEFAGGLAGASAQDMSTALRILARNSREAATGAAEYADDFNAMGISVTDASGQLKSADQLLMDISDGMTRLSTDTERTALAQTLLGRSGAKLIPLLKQGSAAIAAQRQEARDLGLMNQEQIAQAVELTDNQLRLSRAWSSVKFIIAQQLLPAMNRFTTGLTAFLRENRAVIKSGVEKFFRRTGQVINAVVSFVGRLADAFGPLGMQILKVTAIVLGLVAVLMLPGVPILLLIGLIALLIEDFEAWRRGADSVIGDIVEWFSMLGDAVAEQAKRFGQWVKDHQTGLTLVASLIAALALVIGVKLVTANATAIASFLALKAMALITFAATSAASVAAALASAAAWVIATAPVLLMLALLTIIIGTLIFLGAELVKLAHGKENFFSTMAQGISDLIDKFGGIGPAIWEMLQEAAKYWLEFFGVSEDYASDFVNNVYQTLIGLWDNVLEYWSDKLGGWWDKWSNLIDFGFGEDEKIRRPQAPGVSLPAVPSVLATPGAISSPATAGAGNVVNQSQVVNQTINATPGMDTRELGRVIVDELDKKQARDYRAASQQIAVGAP